MKVYVGPTPGPYYVTAPDPDGGVGIESPMRLEWLAYVYRPSDAQLLAAAPIMLDALDKIVGALRDSPDAVNAAVRYANDARALARAEA